MFASVVAIEEKLAESIQNYADDRCCLLELLRFFGKHPYTRFGHDAVIQALRAQGIFAERGLKYIVDRGIVVAVQENRIRLYSLASEEPMRSWALDLGRLDLFHWQLLVRRVGCEA